MDIALEFVNRYRREYDYFDQVSRIASQSIDRQLTESGIRAMVTYRAKNPDRLLGKIRSRIAQKGLQTVEDIYNDIVDLSGVRVAMYFPGERNEVERIIKDMFVLMEDPKIFPQQSRKDAIPEKRFSGYWAIHFRVKLKPEQISNGQERYLDTKIEIQIASVLMHAWSEVEHDLVYKPLQGRLSEDEYAILDELNGLVLAGEIALERLQRAGGARVNAQGGKFLNHFELASYLINQIRKTTEKDLGESYLGRVDILFSLASYLDKATPEGMLPYLSNLSSDEDNITMSDQLIDALIRENSGDIENFFNLIPDFENYIYGEDDGYMAILGKFVNRWKDFESRAISVYDKIKSTSTTLVPNRLTWIDIKRLIIESKLLNSSDLALLETIRDARNQVVHGGKAYGANQLNVYIREIDEIIARLEKNGEAKKRKKE